jgi:hypothetical protein
MGAMMPEHMLSAEIPWVMFNCVRISTKAGETLRIDQEPYLLLCGHLADHVLRLLIRMLPISRPSYVCFAQVSINNID